MARPIEVPSETLQSQVETISGLFSSRNNFIQKFYRKQPESNPFPIMKLNLYNQDMRRHLNNRLNNARDDLTSIDENLQESQS
jgi:hypothetical protein